MNVIWQEALIHTRVRMRERSSAFWAYVFPVMLLILFCSIFGKTIEDYTAILAGMICITSMTGAFYGVGLNLVALREQNVLKQYKVTPSPLWKMILGICLSQVFTTILTTVWLFVIAKTFYKIALPSDVWAFLLVFTAGALMFCAIAFVIAGLSRSSHQASALIQVIFMPMIFLSGSLLPYEAMPAWAQKIALALPATYYVLSLRHVLSVGGEGNMKNLAVMGIVFLLAAGVSIKSFRRE